jgi:hypothetical protein
LSETIVGVGECSNRLKSVIIVKQNLGMNSLLIKLNHYKVHLNYF